MKLMVTLIAIVLPVLHCIAQFNSDYCELDKGIQMSHLHLGNDGEFVLRSYIRYHTDVYETVDKGHYIQEHDTLFFSTNPIFVKDSVPEYRAAGYAIGYIKDRKFYFGKGPYLPMNKCSEKSVKRLRRKL